MVGDNPAGRRANPGLCYLGVIDHFLVYGGTAQYGKWRFDPVNEQPFSRSTAQRCYLGQDSRQRPVILQGLKGKDPEWLGLRYGLGRAA